MRIKIVAKRGTGRLLGAQSVGGEDASKCIEALAKLFAAVPLQQNAPTSAEICSPSI